MNKESVEKLRGLIDRFLTDEDHSLALANEIEGLIIEHFSEANFYDNLLLSLSLYQPGGGEHLDNEETLSWELRQAVIELKRLY
jgi:hypothetical protein